MPIDTNEVKHKNSYGVSAIVALLIIVGLGGWFIYYTFYTQPLIDQTLREQFVWNIAPSQPLASSPGPRSSVTLKVAEAVLPVGTYPGSCTIVDGKTLALLSGELSGVVCRSGDGGTEVGIFKEEEQLSIKQSPIEGASGRGKDFTPLVKQSS